MVVPCQPAKSSVVMHEHVACRGGRHNGMGRSGYRPASESLPVCIQLARRRGMSVLQYVAGAPLNSGSSRSPVICAGLYGSGSTWAYNVVRALLQQAGPGPVAGFYADEIAAQHEAALQDSAAAAIKCHRPGPGILALTRLAGLPVILTLRDPRDCVASMMQRFGVGFGAAHRQVVASAAAALRLRALPRVLVLHYEAGAIGAPRTIRAIAEHLGITVDAATIDGLARALSAETVRAHVAALEAAGRFAGGPPATTAEPETAWHPGHVGDGRIGKHDALLSPEQAAAVLHGTADYGAAFGYGGEDAGLPSPASLRFAPDEPGPAFLGDGAAPVEQIGAFGWGTWLVGEWAELVLPLRPIAGRNLHLTVAALPGPGFWQPGPARALIRVNGAPALTVESPVPQGTLLQLGYRAMLPEGKLPGLTIAFEFAGLRSPAELGVNADTRLLGLALLRVGVALD